MSDPDALKREFAELGRLHDQLTNAARTACAQMDVADEVREAAETLDEIASKMEDIETRFDEIEDELADLGVRDY